jgi:hypothetical protein
MLGLALAPVGCRNAPSSRAPTQGNIEPVTTEVVGNARLRVSSAEAGDALAVMTAASPPACSEAWMKLKATEEYRRLGEREQSFHRAMSDTTFYEWLTADSTAARATMPRATPQMTLHRKRRWIPS